MYFYDIVYLSCVVLINKPLIDWLVGWLVGWLAGWLAGWLVEFSLVLFLVIYEGIIYFVFFYFKFVFMRCNNVGTLWGYLLLWDYNLNHLFLRNMVDMPPLTYG